ncbi:MAG: DUF983 domain-containing protein [Dehalococcoidia bacterium]
MNKLKGILQGRCPRCSKGQIFQPGLMGLLFMNDECEVCGLRFLRESGYYLGAMYVSYGLGVLTVLPVATYLGAFARWPLWSVFVVMVVQTLVSMLLFLRFSRTIWLYFDEAIDPQKNNA